MKSKFLTAAALACAISLAAPGIASAQGTSSVSASGDSTFCSINGVEVSCGASAGSGFEMPDFEMPDFELPDFEMPDFELPAFDGPSFDRPSFDGPSFDRPSFDGPTFEIPVFEFPDLPTSGNSSSVTVTSSFRAISNGTSGTTTSTSCTLNGVQVACGPGTSAFARPSFDFSVFGR